MMNECQLFMFLVLLSVVFNVSQGLYATRDIKEGELVLEYENKAITLVSKTYADKCLNKSNLEKEWFENYAYPVSDRMFVTWSEDPEKYTPINHSCDPNIWYANGFDNQYARRDIKKGEHITLDYAMFLANNKLQFECKCEAKCCRKVIKSNDFMKPEIIEKYKGHFSNYLTHKINSMSFSAE